MSDSELAHSESLSAKEEMLLVTQQEKAKHASSYSEKDDATLLSDGTSDNSDEEDLVLEYSESAKISGELQETVDFEKGDSVSGSDDEIAGLTDDQVKYKDVGSVHKNLDSVEDSLTLETSKENQQTVKQDQESVAKDEEISRIAETLSTQMDLRSEEKESKTLSAPGRPVVIVMDGNEVKDSKGSRGVQRQSSSSSLSDSGRFSTSKKDDRASSNHSSDEDLEWDEEYEFGNRINGSRSGRKIRIKDKEFEEVPKIIEQQSKDGTKKTKKPAQKESAKDILVTKAPKVRSHTASRPLEDKLSTRKSGSGKAIEKVAPKSQTKGTSGKEKGQSKNNMQNKESVTKSSVEKSKKSIKRTRYKIYLDDPDIHQNIAEFSGLLRKLKEEVEKGEFIPKPTSRLHPQSRDDVVEGSHKRRQSRKYISAKSTSVDQPRGSKVFEPIHQAKSDGHLGPYDGHGKRGRNLIARIKDLSESSSSSGNGDDDDELTNAGVFRSKIKERHSAMDYRKENKEYEFCSECGQLHSADEDTNDESDNELCPDCGVPHNPFKHPPSPSSKDPPEPAKEETLPSIEGPHTTEELKVGAKYKMKYLGTTQVTTQHPVTKETRMEQAQQAYARIKVADGEVQPTTDVQMVISLERIKVVNLEGKHEDVMLDHALRTVCFICDIGDILVLMSRRLTTEMPDLNLDTNDTKSLSDILAEREKRTSKNICHIFHCVEAQTISKAIGQAFNMAYRQFLKSNGISHDSIEEAEYCHVLESQKIVGQDLDLLADSTNTRDVVIQKKRGEAIGVMLLESGWGSMLPTVFVAHISNYSPAARLGGQLCVGDHILACNGASFVGLPLSECNQILRNTRSSARVMLRIVSCPPVVDVVVTRPDVKYQLGFSVQNGTICSLLRGGIAERGGVRVGHRIIEINGESVVAKSHQHIVDILATTSGEISMKTLPVAMYRLMVGIDTPTHV